MDDLATGNASDTNSADENVSPQIYCQRAELYPNSACSQIKQPAETQSKKWTSVLLN